MIVSAWSLCLSHHLCRVPLSLRVSEDALIFLNKTKLLRLWIFGLGKQMSFVLWNSHEPTEDSGVIMIEKLSVRCQHSVLPLSHNTWHSLFFPARYAETTCTLAYTCASIIKHKIGKGSFSGFNCRNASLLWYVHKSIFRSKNFKSHV